MKLQPALIFCALVFINSSVGLNNANANEQNTQVLSDNSGNSCKFDVSFASDPTVKKQTIKVSQGVELKLKQYVAVRNEKGANIASNVICQHLIGQQYTGSQEEWKGFINTAVQGMLQHGFKDLQFTKVGTDDAIYKGQYPNYEYTFTGDIDGNKQIIHNLAVLDKKNNQVITFSVSGNEKVKSNIKTDYENLINSFSL